MPSIRSNSNGHNAAKNNNPKGKNQHKDCPPVDDPRIPELLKGYHRRNITDRKQLSKLLHDDHGIIMSESTVARRKRELGLRGSGKTTLELPDSVKRQLVLDQMNKDPSGKIGAPTVKNRIFEETGIDITRDWIRKEMQILAPAAFASRRPRHQAPRSERPPKARPTNVLPHPTTSCPTVTPQVVTQSVRPSVTPTHESYEHPSDNSDSEDEDPDYSFELRSSPVFQSPTILDPASRLAPAINSNGTRAMSLFEIIDIVERETPKMASITRLLSTIDFGQLQDPVTVQATAYGRIMKCMESAALLERQLSRFASGIQLERPS